MKSRGTVYLLTGCMALQQTALSLNMTVAALAGTMLAGSQPYLATLPLALTFVVLMASSVPASMLIGRIGWKPTFALGSMVGCAGGLISAYAMVVQSFWLFCVGLAVYGFATAVANYYRFAAAESVPHEQRSRAISTVLTGGVIAAILGPFLAVKGSDFFVYSFAGSYIVMAVLSISILPVLATVRLNLELPGGERESAEHAPRSLGAIARQPVFLIAALGAMLGYGSMNLIMVSTPTAMVACGFVMADAASVIQWHVLGMYLPSFFSGHLIRRFGATRIMGLGAVIVMICAVINLTGIAYANFLSSLVLLGLGWNFLYVGGSTLVTEAYRPGERSRTLGLNEVMVTGMTAVTALSSGAIFAEAGWAILNLAVLPPLVVLTVAIAWFSVHRRRSVALT
ncbi:MAG: MFS transporter [Kiloniellales bacterium]